MQVNSPKRLSLSNTVAYAEEPLCDETRNDFVNAFGGTSWGEQAVLEARVQHACKGRATRSTTTAHHSLLFNRYETSWDVEQSRDTEVEVRRKPMHVHAYYISRGSDSRLGAPPGPPALRLASQACVSPTRRSIATLLGTADSPPTDWCGAERLLRVYSVAMI